MPVLRFESLGWVASRTCPFAWRARCWQRAFSTVAASARGEERKLTLIHFNDVYDITSRTTEPVGGAARFASLVYGYQQEQPLVLFSGDCLNPSLLSAFTKGEQMVPILNAIGVRAAVVGNHDFDFGVDVLRQHMAKFAFPWLLSNVLDAATRQPLGGAQRSVIIPWQGVKVGLMGLVEREWLLTIPCIEADRDAVFLDYVEEGRRLTAELRRRGADLVIALTHMRAPNDLALAAAVPEIQLILGGHDHDYEVTCTQPHGTMLFKSGTDFREFSVIHITLPPAAAAGGSSGTQQDNSSSSSTSSGIWGHTTAVKHHGSGGSESCVAPGSGRPAVAWERVEVSSRAPEHPGVSATIARYQELVTTRMDQPLGRSFVPLDARFDTVRTRESNAGNLLGDIMRLGLDADAAFFNGGTIRSERVHAAGRMCMRDFVSMLPFTDELVVLELSGRDILVALETGVSSWPRKEGRFLQVSGLSFAFDPVLPPGARIILGTVVVAGAPLDLTRRYRVATKAYLRSGKDGFESLRRAAVVVDGETAPRLATLVHYLLTRVEELNRATGVSSEPPTSSARAPSTTTTSGGSDGREWSSSHAAAEVAVAAATGRHAVRHLVAVAQSPVPPPPCAHGLDALYYYDTASQQYGIAPMVEGRIRNVVVQEE